MHNEVSNRYLMVTKLLVKIDIKECNCKEFFSFSYHMPSPYKSD